MNDQIEVGAVLKREVAHYRWQMRNVPIQYKQTHCFAKVVRTTASTLFLDNGERARRSDLLRIGDRGGVRVRWSVSSEEELRQDEIRSQNLTQWTAAKAELELVCKDSDVPLEVLQDTLAAYEFAMKNYTSLTKVTGP